MQPPSGPELAREQKPPPAAPPPAGSSLDDESEATTSGEAEPVEVASGPKPDAAQMRPDWHASLRDAAPAADDAALTGESLFGKPPRRATTSFASPRPAAARWLALVFLVIIVLAAAVMFRDVIVQAFPGLAPVYASMGLLVHPAVAPRG